VSYAVRILRSVEREIASWNLPNGMLVDIYLRLKEDLLDRPFERMVRIHKPFEGMIYGFDIADPNDPNRRYFFVSHMMCGQDEETLTVISAGLLPGP